MTTALKELGRELGAGLKRNAPSYAAPDPEVVAARKSYLALMEYAARDETGEPLHIDAYTWIVASTYPHCHAAGRHISEVSFPGIGKSTRARWYGLHCLGHDKEITLVAISGDKEASRHCVTFCREQIDKPEPGGALSKFRRVFPDIVPDNEKNRLGGRKGWRQHEFFLQNVKRQSPDPTMQAVAMRPKRAGLRAQILLADDVMTREIAESQEQRNDNCAAFDDIWIEGRLKNPGGREGWCIVQQNPWHKDDLAHRLRKDRRFMSLWVGVTNECDALFVRIWNPPEGLPLIEDPAEFDAEPIAPNDGADYEFTIPLSPGLTQESLLDERRDSPEGFRRRKRLIALDDKDKMYPSWTGRKQFDGTVAEMLGVREMGGLPVFDDIARIKYQVTGGLDLAGGKRKGDSLTFFAGNAQGEKFPLIHFRGKFSVAEIIELIDLVWRLGIHFAVLGVENNATQEKIRQVIQSQAKEKGYEWWGRIQPHTTGRNKSDPENGLPAMDPEFESGAIIWPSKESSRKDWAHARDWAQWETEMAECPRIFASRDMTPDSVMSMWFAWLRLIGLRHQNFQTVSEAVTLDDVRGESAEAIL